jgi:hypothetical protein
VLDLEPAFVEIMALVAFDAVGQVLTMPRGSSHRAIARWDLDTRTDRFGTLEFVPEIAGSYDGQSQQE